VNTVAKLLALLSAVLLPLALTGVWAERVVTDTDGYVAAVAPLADDPEVQQAVADRLAATVAGAAGLDPTGGAAGEVVAAAARRVVTTNAFAQAWRRGNRAAHRQLVRAAEAGRGSQVVLSLDPLVAPVLDVLSARGLPVPESVDTGVQVQLASSRDVERLRTAYRVLDATGPLLPVAWAVVLVLALLLGRRRRGTLVVAALASTVACVLLWLGVRAAGSVAARRVGELDRDLARAAYEAVTADLRTWSLLAAGASLVVLLLAALAPRGRRTRADP
jgi:hypothetical protein